MRVRPFSIIFGSSSLAVTAMPTGAYTRRSSNCSRGDFCSLIAAKLVPHVQADRINVVHGSDPDRFGRRVLLPVSSRPMSDVVIIGGGVAGLGTALALSRSGDHRITVLERDRAPLPDTADEAFSEWKRRGAPQTRHSHAFLARLRNLLRDRAPDVLDALLEAGATELRFTERMPDTIDDPSPKPGDEDLVALACRRATFEWVLRRAVLHEGRVSFLDGCAVAGLEATDRHVTGVRLEDGRVIAADLVVDASGRRSSLPKWLDAIGAGPVHEEVEDTGIVYYSRFYRLCEGKERPSEEQPIGGDLGYVKVATFPADNRTFSITYGVPTDDHDLRILGRLPAFEVAARAIPFAAA